MPPDPAILDPVANSLCQQRGYDYVSFLGAGGFKRVYLIRQSGESRALKLAILRPNDARLERETQALKACNHANIAKIHEAFKHVDNGREFWVSVEELLDGGTLERKLSLGPMSASEVKGLGIVMADVLMHFRSRKIVHRDIKPANIMYRTGDTAPVLTDFGVARLLSESTLTHDFLAIGPCTPQYASPEQLNNEKQLIDFRTDQFGLALVLSECLLGRHAFQHVGNDLDTAILDVRARNQLPLQTVNDLTARGFNCLVQALELYPVKRYSNPAEFARVLAVI